MTLTAKNWLHEFSPSVIRIWQYLTVRKSTLFPSCSNHLCLPQKVSLLCYFHSTHMCLLSPVPSPVPSPPRHVHLWPLPWPWWLLPGGVQPLWPSSEAAGIWKALRAETRPSGQAVCPTALSHPCTTAPAEAPPQPLSFPWDQCCLRFTLGVSWPRSWAAPGSPTFTFHPTPVQTLQELQGCSTVRAKVGQCLLNWHMTMSAVKYRERRWQRCLQIWGIVSSQRCHKAAVVY